MSLDNSLSSFKMENARKRKIDTVEEYIFTGLIYIPSAKGIPEPKQYKPSILKKY